MTLALLTPTSLKAELGEQERARNLFERLLDRTQHVKVWGRIGVTLIGVSWCSSQGLIDA